MELKEASSIVVDVIPTPKEETCFIAIPFSNDFQPLLGEIIKASVNVGLKPVCTQFVQEGLTFVDDFKKGIRSAQVVIAVLTPEASTSRPNPNVLYELGFAHAIGKPVIMLTSDPKNVPADIEKEFLKAYDPSAKIGLWQVIAGAIQTETKLMNNPFTNPRVPNVTATDRKHRRLLEPEFWRSFGRVVSFSKDIERSFTTIDMRLDVLQKAANKFQKAKGDKLKEWDDFSNEWKQYCVTYNSSTFATNLASLGSELAEVAGCFDPLRKDAGDERIEHLVDESHKVFVELESNLQKYQTFHEALESKLGGECVAIPEPDDLTEFIRDIGHLRSVANACFSEARDLFGDLLKITLMY